MFSLREQLNLVTAAAQAADRELAEKELTRIIDEQVIAERDRAISDRDAARMASETANREASITKRQRDEYMSLLAAESARLVQVQQELQQARESEGRGQGPQHPPSLRCPHALKCPPVSGGGHQCRVQYSSTLQGATSRRTYAVGLW